MLQEVIQLLRNAGLPDKVVNEVSATYKPAYRLSPIEKEDYSIVGNSRIGGLPDLPDNIKHPLASNGEAMQLVIQINLSELAEKVCANLPKFGMLYLFNNFDDFTGKIFYYGGEVDQLERSEYHLSDSAECGILYKGYKLGFTLISTVDQYLLYNSMHIEAITVDYNVVYSMLKDSLLTQESRLGGNGTSLETDHIVGAYSTNGNLTDEEQAMIRHDLHIEGNNSYPIRPYLENELTSEKHSKNDKSAIRKQIDKDNRLAGYAPKFVQNRAFYQNQIRKWHNLLNIASIDECGMCWSDAGTLTYCVNEDDLKALNFHNIYCDLDCG